MNRMTVRMFGVCAVLAASVSALSAQAVTIDVRMNVAAADAGNYFNWTQGSSSTKDKLDAASGASLSGSTAKFDAVRYDDPKTKKAAIPVGLRGFVLFPVSGYDIAKADNLTATANGKAITVRFVHYGVANELVTDKNGKFNVLTGSKRAKGFCDNVGGEFVLKSEFVKAGGDPKNMADLDWSKLTFAPDAKDAAASRWYEGSLDFALKGTILTVKGTLKEVKAK